MKLFLTSFFFLMAFTASSQIADLPEGAYILNTNNDDTSCTGRDLYYYQLGGKYPESATSLLPQLHSFIDANKKRTGSGYITFRFRVSCKGKVMRQVQVLQTDDHYKTFQFDKGLVEELFSFFNTLNKWKAAKNQKGEQVSYLAFMTFKIEDGKVSNIIP